MKHETQVYDIDEGNALVNCEEQYENSKLFFPQIHHLFIGRYKKHFKKKLRNNLF